MSKSVVSDLLLHATSAMDTAEQHLFPLMDGAIAALGRGKSLMERSAAVQHQAAWRRLLFGDAPPGPSIEGSQLSRLLSGLAADVFVAQQLFNTVVAPLIGQATEVSTIFVHVEANITTLMSELSLLNSYGWVTSASQGFEPEGGSTTLLTYWDMASTGSVKNAVDNAINEILRHQGILF